MRYTSRRPALQNIAGLLAVFLVAACDSGGQTTINRPVGRGHSDTASGLYFRPPPDPNPGPVPDAGTGELPDNFCRTDAGAVDFDCTESTLNIFGARGLYTSPSSLSAAPPGSALEADNLVVDVPDEYTTRKGFEYVGPALPGNLSVSSWTTFQGGLVAHVLGTSKLYRYVSGAWSEFPGTYLPPSPGVDEDGNPILGQVKFFETQQTLYVTTSAGMYRLESIADTPEPAGVVQAIAGAATVSGAGQALSTNSATAYRYVWGRRAANGRIMLGAPSTRVTVFNRSESFTFVPVSLVRASNVVTVGTTTGVASNVLVGQAFELTAVAPGDAANFPVGVKIITSVGASSFTYAETGANATAGTPAGASITTTATPVKIAHVVPILAGVDETYFLQVYRSDEVPQNVEPSDEMYLVYEKSVSEMPTGATTHSFEDDSPDAVKADALYTNVNSGGGILAAHYAPPKAVESVVFQNRAFYANVELNERLSLTVLAVGPGGLNVGMGFSISLDASLLTGTTYTAGTTESGTTFKVFTDGTPAQNIANTVQSIVRVINATSGGLVYARFEPSSNGLNVGQFTIESRSVGSATLRVTARQSSPFIVPALPYEVPVVSGTMERVFGQTTVVTPLARPHGFTVGQTVFRDATSTVNPDFPEGQYVVAAVFDANTFAINDPGVDAVASVGSYRFLSTAQPVRTDDEAAPGGWMVSDEANPDSVPALIPEIAGDRYKRAMRLLPMGDSLFLLKEDGLYRLTGTAPENYSVECVDSTIHFIAPRAAFVMNNRAYALTTQGLMVWTENGTPVPSSIPIESDILKVIQTAPNEVELYAFALAHESRRRAYLWLPSFPGDTSASQVYVYNALTDAWTRWTRPAVAAMVHPTQDLLYVAPPDVDGSGTAPAPLKERRTGTAADYKDENNEAIQAKLTWTPIYATDGTSRQLVYSTYRFRGTLPATVDVAFATNWSPTPQWWTLYATDSQSPGTMTTPPTMQHSRGNSHTLSIRHGAVGVPFRMLGVSIRERTYTTNQ